MKYYWEYLKTLMKHKYEVFKLCSNCGLHFAGLIHDMSKFSIKEFKAYAEYFNKEPRTSTMEKNFEKAWLHHKHHNPHHWEYWVNDYDNKHNEMIVTAMEIPFRYLVELVCDWVAAGKVYNGDEWTEDEPYNYYMSHCNTMVIHDRSRELIERFLLIIKEDGLDTFYSAVWSLNDIYTDKF